MRNRYEPEWDSLWTAQPRVIGAATWDSDPSLIAALDLPHFLPHVDLALPLVDLGCGNGTQTRFLAEHFPRVIGVDVSEAGLAIAREINGAREVDYRRVDVLDPAGIAALHDELGDVNVYVRGVVHQLDPADRPTAVSALAVLAGTRGRVFLSELLDGELHKLCVDAGFDVLDRGERLATYTESLADGTPLVVPFEFVVAGRPGTKEQMLEQIGLLDPSGLPVSGAESARKVLDPTLPARDI